MGDGVCLTQLSFHAGNRSVYFGLGTVVGVDEHELKVMRERFKQAHQEVDSVFIDDTYLAVNLTAGTTDDEITSLARQLFVQLMLIMATPTLAEPYVHDRDSLEVELADTRWLG